MKKFIKLFLFALLAFCFVPSIGQAKTVKTTGYKECLKYGNNVYCNVGSGIYIVNIKNKKVKELYNDEDETEVDLLTMTKKGSYIYCLFTGPTGGFVAKIHYKKGKYTGLTDETGTENFAISGSKLYYDGDDNDGDGTARYVCKLNGHGRKKTKTKVKLKRVTSNKKGYKIIEEDNDIYLKTPKKTFYIKEARDFGYDED